MKISAEITNKKNLKNHLNPKQLTHVSNLIKKYADRFQITGESFQWSNIYFIIFRKLHVYKLPLNIKI